MLDDTENVVKLLPCDFCEETFKSDFDLQTHKKSVHECNQDIQLLDILFPDSR